MSCSMTPLENELRRTAERARQTPPSTLRTRTIEAIHAADAPAVAAATSLPRTRAMVGLAAAVALLACMAVISLRPLPLADTHYRVERNGESRKPLELESLRFPSGSVAITTPILQEFESLTRDAERRFAHLQARIARFPRFEPSNRVPVDGLPAEQTRFN